MTTPLPNRCGYKLKNGKFCTNHPMHGMKHCRMHLRGRTAEAARVRARATVELQKWQVSPQPTNVDPDETILQLLAQSVARADLYAQKLHQAFEYGEKLQALLRRQTDGETLTDSETAELQKHRDRLDWIFTSGGISALIGHTWSSTPRGQRYATGEEIRALARIEIEERKLAGSFAKIASQRNIAERQIQLAAAQGAAIYAVVFASLRALGVSPDDLTVREIVTAQLSAIGSGRDVDAISSGLGAP